MACASAAAANGRWAHGPIALPDGPNQRWSLDFVSDALASARRFRVLAVVDDFTRECLGLVVDTSLSGLRVGRELDRIASLRGYTDRWIEYPAATRALRVMHDLLVQPNQTRMRGVLIAARPDNGKTSLLRRFLALHLVSARDSGEPSQPVVLASMPDEPSEAKLWSNVLRALNIPHRSSDPARHLREQAVRVLDGDHVRTLMFDEVHDLLHGSAKRQQHLLALLKHLTNELSLRIVLAGTQDVVRALSGDRQLATRFDGFPLPPWSEGKELRTMLTGLEAILPLAEPSNLASREILLELLSVSDRTIGGMVIRLKRAADLAIRTGKERIDVPLLRKVQETAGLDYTAVNRHT